MSNRTPTPEALSELEAAQKQQAVERKAQAKKVDHLLAYMKLRMAEVEGEGNFPEHAHEKRVFRECAEELGVTVSEVRRLMNSAELLAKKLPNTYARYQQGETDMPSVQKINRAIEGISHRPELMEKLDGELVTKARELNSAELGNWLNQRVPQLDVQAFEERYERGKQKHYVAFEPQGDGTTKFHGLISTLAAERIQQTLHSMARNMPRKTPTTETGEPVVERTHTQREADIFTNALISGLEGGPGIAATEDGSTVTSESTKGLQGAVAGATDSQLPLPPPGTDGVTSTGEIATTPVPGPAEAGSAKIGILIPVKTLTGEADDPAISWDRTWMLPAAEARAIAADASAKHDWYAVGVTEDANAGTEIETSTGIGEVLTVTRTRTAPASTSTEDIDQWIGKTDPEAHNLLTKTYESRTARDHQRNAVLIRDGQCQTPGCTDPGWSAEIDHKQSFETGGPTTGENLQTLCRNCHHIKSHKHHPPDPDDSSAGTPAGDGFWLYEFDESDDPALLNSATPPPDWAVDNAA